MDQRELIARARQGDDGAFAQLVEPAMGPLFRHAQRMLGNAQDAEDATQDALVKAYQNLAAYRGEAEFTTWLYRILTNVCLDALRRRRRRPQAAGEDPEQLLARLPDPEGVEDRALAREQMQLLERALAQLPPQMRSLLVLREVDDLSYEQIAQVLGVRVGTVKSRMSRARLKLQKIVGALAEPDGQRRV